MIRCALVLLVLFLTLTPAAAQGRTLGDCLPAAAVYTRGRQLLTLEAVDALRSEPVQGDAIANYDIPPYGRWDYPRGVDLGLEWRLDTAIEVDFLDGGPRLDAYVLTGDTNRPGLVVIGLFLRPTDGTHNWHGRCAYLVAE